MQINQADVMKGKRRSFYSCFHRENWQRIKEDGALMMETAEEAGLPSRPCCVMRSRVWLCPTAGSPLILSEVHRKRGQWVPELRGENWRARWRLGGRNAEGRGKALTGEAPQACATPGSFPTQARVLLAQRSAESKEASIFSRRWAGGSRKSQGIRVPTWSSS